MEPLALYSIFIRPFRYPHSASTCNARRLPARPRAQIRSKLERCFPLQTPLPPPLSPGHQVSELWHTVSRALVP